MTAEPIMILAAEPETQELQISPTLPEPDPDLSAVVVVPARDEAARIGECLRALSHQPGVQPHSFEVIVILDGCRDTTPSRPHACVTPACWMRCS